MTIRKLEHINIRTERLDQTLDFYTQLLLLRDGPRPGNPTRATGAWLYGTDGEPIVHIAAFNRNDAERVKWLNDYLGYRDLDSLNGSGAIDHVALMAEGYEEMIERCRQAGIPYRERVTQEKIRQIFVTDPNGISIELNYR